MKWPEYQKKFKSACSRYSADDKTVLHFLEYAKNLHDSNLPIIYDIEHLSLLLGYNTDLLYRISNCTSKFYRSYSILKKNGKKRKISEPYPTLKEIQKWILYNILEKNKPSKFAKAYIKRKDIKDNVRFHKGQPVVIKIDVKNFFGSIKFQMIYSCFLKMGYNSCVSGMLGKLCCLNECLPQGSPTSPYLSNIYCKSLDKRISNYSLKHKLRYSRYSDDITISGNISHYSVSNIVYMIKLIFRSNKLEMHKTKLKVIKSTSRQIVTGIVVNEKLSIPNNIKEKIRQEVYYIKKFGLDSHTDKTNIQNRNYLNHLKGLINWVITIEPNNDEFLNYKLFLNQ